MKADILQDRVAYRRHRAGAIAFAAALLGTVPAAVLVGGMLLVTLGPATVAGWGPALFVIGPLGAAAAAIYALLPAIRYRCPRCRSRVDRVEPVGVKWPNLCYRCRRCGVVWDLGWGQGEAA